MNKRVIFSIVLLILALILAACGGDDTTADTSTQPESTVIPDILEFDDDSPEFIVVAFLDACEIGDRATALDQLTIETRQLAIATDSPICEAVDDMEGATANHYHTETTGNTARVEWQWLWEGSERRYLYELANTDNGWRIFDGDYSYRNEEAEDSAATPEANAPINVVTNTDDALLEGVSYVAQRGIAGQSDTIIATGSMPRAQFMAEAKAVVEQYFALYQGNDFAGLSGLVYPDDIENFDIATANATAAMEIIEVDIDEPTQIAIYGLDVIDESYRPEPAKDNTLSGLPYTEAPIVEVSVPIFARFNALGQTWTDEIALAVLYRPETQSWQMRYWGVLTAVGQQKVQNRSDYELQITGLALTHNATLVTMNVLRPLPADLLWMDVVVYDDMNSRPSMSSHVKFDGETSVGYVSARRFDPHAVNAIVWFRMSPRGILSFYDGEIGVPLP